MKKWISNTLSMVTALAIIAGVFYGFVGKDLLDSYLDKEDVVYEYNSEADTVTASYVSKVSPLGVMKVTASSLNVRKTPNGDIIGGIKKSEVYHFVGFSGNWLQFVYKGDYAFVHSKYTEIYSFEGNLVTINDIKAVFGTDNIVIDTELNEEDIAYLDKLQSVSVSKYSGVNATETAAAENHQALSQEELAAKAYAEMQAEQEKLVQAAILEQEKLAQAAFEEQQRQVQAALEEQQKLAQAAFEEQQRQVQAALEEQAKQAQALLAAQQAAEAEKQKLMSKDPGTMSRAELCKLVVYQVITPDMDDVQKAKALNDWLCNHMTYDLRYYTTRDAILVGRGRCQGYANAYKNLMNAAGIPTDYISGYSRGGRHGWNRVLINGAYYYVDVTWNDSTGDYNRYFLLTEAEISRDHQAERINPRTE